MKASPIPQIVGRGGTAEGRYDASGFDFFPEFDENNTGITNMKDLFKSFLAIMLISAAFVVGFQLGKEKEKQKIPKFQEDHGDIDAALD
jgi:hypothetical protein